MTTLVGHPLNKWTAVSPRRITFVIKQAFSHATIRSVNVSSHMDFIALPSTWNVNTNIYLETTDVRCLEGYEKERTGTQVSWWQATDDYETRYGEISKLFNKKKNDFLSKEDLAEMSEVAHSIITAEIADRLLPDDSGRAAAPSRHIANGKKSKAPRAAQRPARRTDVA